VIHARCRHASTQLEQHLRTAASARSDASIWFLSKREVALAYIPIRQDKWKNALFVESKSSHARVALREKRAYSVAHHKKNELIRHRCFFEKAPFEIQL
jgi:hypothetical protein